MGSQRERGKCKIKKGEMLMENKKLLAISALILLALSILAPLTSAFFPDTHYFIQKEVLKTPISSDIYSACANHPDQCFSGNLMSDVSVIFYYTTFKRYAVTHSPAFCKALLEEANGELENACAVGGCMHQTQDPISHEEMVTYAIRHSLIPNSIIHPPAEQHLDNIVNEAHPEVHMERLSATEAFSDCAPLFKRVLSSNDEYRGVNIDSMFDKFLQEVDDSTTGYNPSFNNIKSIPAPVFFGYTAVMLIFATLWLLLIFKRLRYKERRTVLNWITFILVTIVLGMILFVFIANLGGRAFTAYTALIKPVSNFVPIGEAQSHLNEAIENGREFLKIGFPFLIDTDASGGDELESADLAIVGFQYFFGAVIILGLLAMIYFNFRKPKVRTSVGGY